MTPEIKIICIVLWFAALFTIERRIPALKQPQSNTRLGTNASFWIINSLLSLSIVIPLTAWAASHALWLRSPALSGWVVVADLLLLDAWIYGWHRMNHRISFLWRFHQVHHLDELLDSTTAVRFHSAEVLFSALARLPIVLLFSIPLAHVVLFELLVMAHSLFHHANISLPPRLDAVLKRIIITPSLHRMHHHNLQRDTDSNYGTILSVWDVLFRTRNLRVFAPPMKIGVEGGSEKRLLALWSLPFRRG